MFFKLYIAIFACVRACVRAYVRVCVRVCVCVCDKNFFALSLWEYFRWGLINFDQFCFKCNIVYALK